jgi:hypothetical protein
MSRQSANGRAPAPPRPADWKALQYEPAEGTPLRRCRCGANWTDDEPGRRAHRVVFLHEPGAPEPAKPPKEDHADH